MEIKTEKLPKYRSEEMRSRDRILYCKPFLRLAGKTQVYMTNYADHARTRLTHSLEVSQIARTIANGIVDANIDKTEAIALGHDLGHTPFGHAGERELHNILNYNNEKIMKNVFHINEPYKKEKKKLIKKNKEHFENNTGFKHNWQGVRILKLLCNDYPSGCMEIDNDILLGILNHSRLHYGNEIELKHYSSLLMTAEKTCIEGKIVQIADEIAQRHHDIEDAISDNLISTEQAMKILDKLLTEDQKKELIKCSKSKSFFLKKVSSIIVHKLVTNIVVNYKDKDEALDYSADYKKIDEEISKNLKSSVINSSNIQRMDSRGKYIVRKLFYAYTASPLQLPDNVLNDVFREYLRNINFNSNDSNINEILNNKNTFLIFEEPSTCRDLFSKCIGKSCDNIKIYLNNEFISPDNGKDCKDYPLDSVLFKICFMRSIADYIAGMTDSFAETEFHKLYGVIHSI